MSRRDNILVEKEICSASYRPVRDGMCVGRHLKMSRMGLNMYNPLQAKRSWGYKMTLTLSELRSSSICKSEYKYKGTKVRRRERAKGRREDGSKQQAASNKQQAGKPRVALR
ncbi:MAG: hypothetical protein LBL13_09815 [Bacteroidales bacterium]|nr:hypothetical protein [Bacteroidales bacterium]